MKILRPDANLWEEILETLDESGESFLFNFDDHGHSVIQFGNYPECRYVHDLQEIRIKQGLDEIIRAYSIYHELIHREQWFSADPEIISLVRDWKKLDTNSDEYHDRPLEMTAHAGALAEIESRYDGQVPAGSPLRRYGQRPDK